MLTQEKECQEKREERELCEKWGKRKRVPSYVPLGGQTTQEGHTTLIRLWFPFFLLVLLRLDVGQLLRYSMLVFPPPALVAPVESSNLFSV